MVTTRLRLSPALRVRQARGFCERLAGLIGAPPLAADEALLLDRCQAIHTCFMNGPIDLVFLDRELCVCALRRTLPPWRAAWCAKARGVLELAPGAIERLHIEPGDRLLARGCRLHFIRRTGRQG